jgi:hypothetical protein
MFLHLTDHSADVRCNFEGSDDRRTTDIACLSRVAKGEQGEFANDVQPAGFLGHKDAEAFALYAMGKCELRSQPALSFYSRVYG